jgi:RNA polymerase sigma factor (sigma-70 family)
LHQLSLVCYIVLFINGICRCREAGRRSYAMAHPQNSEMAGNPRTAPGVLAGNRINHQSEERDTSPAANRDQLRMTREAIEGCCKGLRESQKKLYELYYAYGMSITLRYSDSRDQAAGMLNDAFMKVFDNIRRYDRERPFRPWFRQVVVNTAINEYHRNNRNREEPGLSAVQQGLATPETITSGISYNEIIGMVQQLTPAYRAVFNLHVIDGYSHEEIAGILGISAGTSKSNLAKAKRNLRSMLENHLTG